MRGYSLLEIALALVVLGILLSAVLAPISLRFELETARKVRTTLEDARSAVYGYAILNRTAQRVAQDDADGNRAYEIPSGRPYLPCPDVTGDGLEDRNDVAAINVIVPLNNAVTMTTQGSCLHQKGMLPWRTLGLQTQGDPWGRHLTYWVDLAFSNQLIGFDETFRADTADPRLPLVVTNRGAANETRLYASRTERDTTGAIVCSDFFQTTIIVGQTGGCPSTPDTTLTERQLNVLTGVMNTTNDSITVGARIVRAHDAKANDDVSGGVIEGAAFVIVSHGKNGFGAIRQQNIATTLSLCAPPPPSYSNEGDQVNAYYRAGHPFLDTDPEDIFKCVPIDNTDELYAENIYVNGPPDNTVPYAPDDIVMWSSPNLLLGQLLRSGVLPIPKLPHLPQE